MERVRRHRPPDCRRLTRSRYAGVLDALTTAADGLDYDYPLKWQPNAIQMYFDLAARALRQMKP